MDSGNIINIVKYIIRSTPYGHLKETIENLKILVGSNLIDEKEIQDEISAYQEDHMRHVNLNDDKIITSKFNKDEENYYYDQSKKLKIFINPLSENIEKISEVQDLNNLSLRNSLDKLLNDYKSRCYKSAFLTNNSSGNLKIFLIISAHNLNYKNYWTGEWLSWWVLEKVDGNDYNLKGNIRANTYYYEEGNIQFNLKTDFDEKLSYSADENTFSNDVIRIIEEMENNIQVDLDGVYDNFSDNYIKPLRRKLPVTGQKMNWNLNQLGGINK